MRIYKIFAHIEEQNILQSFFVLVLSFDFLGLSLSESDCLLLEQAYRHKER